MQDYGRVNRADLRPDDLYHHKFRQNFFPPSIEPYIEEIYPCLPTALNPFTLAVVSYNDELVINVAQRHTDTDVCERFINILNELEIPAYISKVFNFHTMRYGA